jgi:solute carrier family 35 protein C2
MEAPLTNHARRRSASLAGAGAGNIPGGEPAAKRPQRTASQPPIEEDESSDGELSDSSKTESTDLELDDMCSDEALEDDEETGLTARDRRRRRRRKAKHTRFDERILPEQNLSKEEEKMASQSMLRSMLINGLLIGLW